LAFCLLSNPYIFPFQKSQYQTEVHHIDGKGQDSGVVYSEMQDHESEMERMVDQKRKDLYYPRGSSYAMDTGGRLQNLRESCSLEKVRQYHRDFYHLNNMVWRLKYK
jgi:Zn-dependent M16 (insulinase) family peptidase